MESWGEIKSLRSLGGRKKNWGSGGGGGGFIFSQSRIMNCLLFLVVLKSRRIHKESFLQLKSVHLAPVVQTLDSAIHWINHYPLDNSIGFASVYPLDSDLSGGQRYPSFEQLGPKLKVNFNDLLWYCVSYLQGSRFAR